MAVKKERHKTDYFDGFGAPQHKLSYCAFLDVLGFSERITESFKTSDGNALLCEFHSTLSECISNIKKECIDSMLYFKSFTDNVILAHPQFSPDLESEFGFILWSISEYQYRMALKGFFIRGGLSIGNLFVDDNSVYGPALLEAYELESKKAINPIVVLSDDVMGLVLHHVKYYGNVETAPQNRDVWVNSDGKFFLNYLSECIIEGEGEEFVDWKSLRIHRNQIEKCLKQYLRLPVVFSKYAWLANYHNQFCASVTEYRGYSSEVEIAQDKFSIVFKNISQLSF